MNSVNVTVCSAVKERLDIMFCSNGFKDKAINARDFSELYDHVYAYDPSITEDDLMGYLYDVAQKIGMIEQLNAEMNEEDLDQVSGGVVVWKALLVFGQVVIGAYKFGYWVGTYF